MLALAKSSSTGLILIVVATILFVSPAVAQERGSVYKNSLRKGSWALLFEIAPQVDVYDYWPGEYNATLVAYDGLAVVLKRMASEAWGYRAGCLFDTRMVDHGVGDSYNVDVFAQGVRHMASNRQISPFVAAGPTFGHTGASDSTDLRIGIALSLGAEYFPVRWLSILGEYNSVLLYRSKDVRVTTWDNDGEHGWEVPPHRLKSLEFIPTAVRLGVSLYW